jgi:hypothetical protein
MRAGHHEQPERGPHLNHVTLTTGHTRKSYHDEVSAEAIETCMRLLDLALAQPEKHTPIPGIEPQLTITVATTGGALIATVWTPPIEVRNLGPQRAPIAMIGVATRSTSGAKLWDVMHQMRPELPTYGRPQPGTPWVAARLEVGVTLLGEDMRRVMMALGDFERCLAWAWLAERKENW